MKFSIRIGDIVQVVRGNRNRNPETPEKRRGRVLRVDHSRGRVIVEGHNERVKHLKKSQQHPNGGLLRKEAPISISNVLVIAESGEAIPARQAARTEDGKVVIKATDQS